MNQNPLWQLILFRFRAMAREPAVIFWVFAFPILTSIVLGLAFRNRPAGKLTVAVVDAPGVESVMAALAKSAGPSPARYSSAAAPEALEDSHGGLQVRPAGPAETN